MRGHISFACFLPPYPRKLYCLAQPTESEFAQNQRATHRKASFRAILLPMPMLSVAYWAAERSVWLHHTQVDAAPPIHRGLFADICTSIAADIHPLPQEIAVETAVLLGDDEGVVCISTLVPQPCKVLLSPQSRALTDGTPTADAYHTAPFCVALPTVAFLVWVTDSYREPFIALVPWHCAWLKASDFWCNCWPLTAF